MKEKNHGILPTIENLNSSFKHFVEEMTPIFESVNKREEIDYLTKLQQLYSKIEVLPGQVAKSYELIQLVIQSIHSSRTELKKSVDGLLKKTGAQLKRITSTTEDATNKIMDIAEKLDEEQLNIIDMVDKLVDTEKEGQTEIIDEIKDKLRSNQDAAFTIIDYLQFQDITAQQIAGAYSLLADTERTLIFVSNMLKRFDIGDEFLKDAQRLIDKNAFNAAANFTDKSDIQDAIDDLFRTGDENVEVPQDKELPEHELAAAKTAEKANDVDIDAMFANNNKQQASNDEIDIDALFASQNKPAEKTEEKAEDIDIDVMFAENNKKEDANTSVSQDDIDALLNEANKETEEKPEEKKEEKKSDDANKTVSQDDIDALFN